MAASASYDLPSWESSSDDDANISSGELKYALNDSSSPSGLRNDEKNSRTSHGYAKQSVRLDQYSENPWYNNSQHHRVIQSQYLPTDRRNRSDSSSSMSSTSSVGFTEPPKHIKTKASPVTSSSSSARSPSRSNNASLSYGQRSEYGSYSQNVFHQNLADPKKSPSVNERDRERDSSLQVNGNLDMFACREFLLGLSESTKYLSDYLLRVGEYVDKEGELEEKMLSSIASLVYRHGGSNQIISKPIHSSGLPREAYIVQEGHLELNESVKAAIKSIAECFKTRKNVYNDQLRKLRDTSNMATRQAIQNERAECSFQINRLKEQYESEKDSSYKQLKQKVADLSASSSLMEQQLKNAMEELKYFKGLSHTHLAEREKAVNAAIQEKTDEFEKEKLKIAKNAMAEHHKLKEDSTQQVDAAVTAIKSQLEAQKNHEEEIKLLLTNERSRIESDNARLRDQLMQAVAQVTIEKEKCAYRITEETSNFEKQLQTLQVEHLKEQAKLKSDMQELIKHVRAEELQAKADIDQIISRERDVQLTAFTLEMERKEDKFKSEMKRLQAHLEVRFQEDVTRLKHAHEQEIKRLLRENDRLQRLVARAGMTHPYYAAASSINANVQDIHGTSVLEAQPNDDLSLPPSSGSPYRSRSPSRSPVRSPLARSPHRGTAQNFLAQSQAQAQNRWGKLQESLDRQEQRISSASSVSSIRGQGFKSASGSAMTVTNHLPPPPPPDMLPLDEALESAKLGIITGDGHDVASSSKKIGKYMSKLQNYLESDSSTFTSRRSEPASAAVSSDRIKEVRYHPDVYSRSQSSNNPTSRRFDNDDSFNRPGSGVNTTSKFTTASENEFRASVDSLDIKEGNTHEDESSSFDFNIQWP